MSALRGLVMAVGATAAGLAGNHVALSLGIVAVTVLAMIALYEKEQNR